MATIEDMYRILIIRVSSLGDILQTLPALEYLRIHFPSAQIEWAVASSMVSLVEPFVDRVIPISHSLITTLSRLRQERYDVVFDLQGNIKSGLIALFSRGKSKVGFGFSSCREWPGLLGTRQHFNFPEDLPIRSKYVRLLQAYYQDTTPFVPQGLRFPVTLDLQRSAQKLTEGSGAKIMIALCSKWPNKRLPRHCLLTFLQKILDHYPVTLYLVAGTDAETLEMQALGRNLKGKTVILSSLPFPLWQACMLYMCGVIAVDSVALHLAGMSQCPTLSLFGPTQAAIFNPEGASVLQGVCPYQVKFMKQCPYLRSCKTGACMDFSSNTLFEAFQGWYQNRCETSQL